LTSARGQSYAVELRQQYDAALRQQNQLPRQPPPPPPLPGQQLPRQHQPQEPDAAGDDDAQSIATTSTTTAMDGGLCWRCCGRRLGSEDPATLPYHRGGRRPTLTTAQLFVNVGPSAQSARSGGSTAPVTLLSADKPAPSKRTRRPVFGEIFPVVGGGAAVDWAPRTG